jgi:hypothetical protein
VLRDAIVKVFELWPRGGENLPPSQIAIAPSDPFFLVQRAGPRYVGYQPTYAAPTRDFGKIAQTVPVVDNPMETTMIR